MRPGRSGCRLFARDPHVRVTHLPPRCDRAYRRIRHVSADGTATRRANVSSTSPADPRLRVAPMPARVLVIGSGRCGHSRAFATRALRPHRAAGRARSTALYWRPGLRCRHRADEWEAIVRESICRASAGCWHGNYGGTMALRLAAADTRDLPRRAARWTCSASASTSASIRQPRRHAMRDMGPGCPEKLAATLEFLRWIWTLSRRAAPAGCARAHSPSSERSGGRLVVLRGQPGRDAGLSSMRRRRTLCRG